MILQSPRERTDPFLFHNELEFPVMKWRLFVHVFQLGGRVVLNNNVR